MPIPPTDESVGFLGTFFIETVQETLPEKQVEQVMISITNPQNLSGIADYASVVVQQKVVEAVESGIQVTVRLEAKQIEQEMVSQLLQGDVIAITGKAEEMDLQIAQYMTFEVIVRVEGEDVGNVTQLQEPITVEFVIPEEMKKEGRTFYMVRIHGDTTEILDVQEINGVFSFITDRFSTYTFGYKDEPVEVDAPSIHEQESPKESYPWAIAGIIVTAGIGMIQIRKKKQ